MNIIIKVEPCQTVTVESKLTTVQNFIVVDADLKPVEISVWGKMTSTMGPLLVQAVNNNSVLLARRLKITRYGVISLLAKNGSLFALNPPVEAATNMKSWFDTVRDDVLSLLFEGQPMSNYCDLIYDGSMKANTVADLQNETQGSDYWIRGLLQLYEADQRLYYTGFVSCIRPLVTMLVTDDTGSSDVVAVGSVDERIM
ncbi:hypothetical protein LIER_20068 [Lithospermum erythrorhizon]|uniref:Uncharacterized protein n=1 Tax=Lithospermum erythrorhizon TaxID=34254 RepID=A0AAV3QMV5_LITER